MVSEIEHLMLLNDERNSLLYWYPKLEANIPTPKTVWIEVDRWLKGKSIYEWLINDFPRGFVKELRKLAREMGYPLFIRTDQYSGKHYYREMCYVETEDDLIYNLKNLLDMSIMLDLDTRAIVLREFIELDWRFRAFSGGLPIAPEVRYFIKDGEVLCWHFYWPEDAIQFVDRDDWKERLKEMRELTEEELDVHRKLAEKVAGKFEGYWSVDFARTRDGRWILIDMALGAVSWHPECSKKK